MFRLVLLVCLREGCGCRRFGLMSKCFVVGRYKTPGWYFFIECQRVVEGAKKVLHDPAFCE